MKCFDCGIEAAYYVSVVYTMDKRWRDPGTDYSDDYACHRHLTPYIASHFTHDGVEVVEVKAQLLGVDHDNGF